MSGQEEKRIIVKVAYNYFQESKWDMALAEYEKLALVDPMDFLVHNMMAEIYVRKCQPEKAVDEYLKAAGLLYATNNIDKAIHAYKQILKHNNNHAEAGEKIEKLIDLKMQEIDKLLRDGKMEAAYEQCRKLSFRVPENDMVNEKFEQIEKIIEDSRSDIQDNNKYKSAAERNEQQTNEELVNNLIKMAERYEQKQSWDEAVETYLTILRFQPEDFRTKTKLNELYCNISKKNQTTDVLESPVVKKPAAKTPPKADFSSTYNEMEKLRQQAEECLRQAVQERRERDKKNQGKIEVNNNEDKEKDIQILMTQAQMYINQNMLVEALRICQRILGNNPANKEVRKILKKIYDKKKLS